MFWVYFDASALIKRYAPETGTPLVNEIFHSLPVSRMTCSTLGILEIISILTRKRNDGRLSQTLFDQCMIEFRNAIIDNDAFLTTPVNDVVLLSSLDLIWKHNLNATDAIILWSVIKLRRVLQLQNDDLVLSTSDRRLVRAAQAESITVFDPEVDTIIQLYQLFDLPLPASEQAPTSPEDWDVEL
jgi:predicted nucleic acid-binding protein